MSTEDPDDTDPTSTPMLIDRAEFGGWHVMCGGRMMACFSTMAELTAWLNATFQPLDVPLDDVPAPLPAPATGPSRLPRFMLFRGGRE